MRVAKGGVLRLTDGKVKSERWLDIQPGGTLEGHGEIHAHLYTKGTLALSRPIDITGTAYLGGELTLAPNTPITVKPGSQITLLKAKSISGKFTNTSITVGGKKYSLVYSEKKVSLKSN